MKKITILITTLIVSFLFLINFVNAIYTLNTFSDDSTVKDLTFSGIENQTIYLKIPKEAIVNSANLDIEGLKVNIWDWTGKNNYPKGTALTTDGNYIWIINSENNSIERYDMGGNYIDNFALGDKSVCASDPLGDIYGDRDITYVNGYLYILAYHYCSSIPPFGTYNMTVWRYNTNGTFDTYFKFLTDYRGTGITYDGTYFYITNNGGYENNGVYRYDSQFQSETPIYTGYDCVNYSKIQQWDSIIWDGANFWLSASYNTICISKYDSSWNQLENISLCSNVTGNYCNPDIPISSFGSDGTFFYTSRGYNHFLYAGNPTNNSLEVGGIDGDYEWNHIGSFNSKDTIFDFSTEINNYLLTCSADVNEDCLVPLTFYSESTGRLDISNLSLSYVIPNHAPTIDYYYPNNLNFIIDEGTSQWFMINASDIDNDILIYYWYLNGNLVSNINEFTFSPNYTQSGNYNLRCEVSDGQLNTSMEWNITVNNVNRNPNIVNYYPLTEQLNITQGETIDFNVSVIDFDGDPLFIYWIVAPTYDFLFNSYNYTYIFNIVGNYEIILNVTDGNGGVATKSWFVNVDVPAAPGGCNDTDNDTICNNLDNCLTVYNPDQLDYDNDSIGDACDSINGNTTIDNSTVEINNSTNLTQQYNGTLTVMFKQANEIVAEFNYNFSEAPLNLTNIYVERELASASKAYIILRGLELQDNNTKTLYMNNLNINTNLNWVCIKDTEINSINTISRTCHAPNEYHIQCNGETFNGYTCNKTDGNFVITGLRHSGITETSYGYGDLDGDGWVSPSDLNMMRNLAFGLNIKCSKPIYNSNGYVISRTFVPCSDLAAFDPCPNNGDGFGTMTDYYWVRGRVLGQANPVCNYV